MPKLGKAIGMRLRERALENDGHLAEMVITKLFQKARKGDLKAIQIVLEYLEGKPAQTLNLNSNESPKVADIDQQLAELRDTVVRRAAARADDSGGKAADAGVTANPGKDTSLQ